MCTLPLMARTRKQAQPAPVTVDPPRPLGRYGRSLWDEVHDAGEVKGSVEPLLMLCERLDERFRLRAAMNRVDDTGQPIAATTEQHASLRALEGQIEAAFRDLGIRTILPNRGAAIASDNWAAELAALRG